MRFATPIALALLACALVLAPLAASAEEDDAPAERLVVQMHGISHLLAESGASGEDVVARVRSALPALDDVRASGEALVVKATPRQHRMVAQLLEDWRRSIRPPATEAPADDVTVSFHDVTDLDAAVGGTADQVLEKVKRAWPDLDVQLLRRSSQVVLVVKGTADQHQRVNQFLEDWRASIHAAPTTDDAALEVTYNDVRDLVAGLGRTTEDLAAHLAREVPYAEIQPQGDAALLVTATPVRQEQVRAQLAALRARLARTASEGPKITLSFENEDVRNVIRVIAEFTGTNVVISPDVQGRISMKVHDVPWRTALETAVTSVGAVLTEEEHGILRIHVPRPREEVVDTPFVDDTVSPLADRELTVHFEDAKVEQILSGLRDELGVTIGTTPGAAERLEGKRATLLFVKAEAGQVLDTVASLADLRWRFEPGVGVVFFTPQEGDAAFTTPTPAPARPEPAFDRPFTAGDAPPADLAEAVRALREEIRALRAEVQEVKALLEKQR